MTLARPTLILFYSAYFLLISQCMFCSLLSSNDFLLDSTMCKVLICHLLLTLYSFRPSLSSPLCLLLLPLLAGGPAAPHLARRRCDSDRQWRNQAHWPGKRAWLWWLCPRALQSCKDRSYRKWWNCKSMHTHCALQIIALKHFVE